VRSSENVKASLVNNVLRVSHGVLDALLAALEGYGDWSLEKWPLWKFKAPFLFQELHRCTRVDQDAILKDLKIL